MNSPVKTLSGGERNRLLLAKLFEAMGHYDRALIIQLEALQNDPLNPRIQFELGQLYLSLDRPEDARRLAAWIHGIPCKINLIPFNSFPQSGYERPSGNAVSRFWQVLVDAGYIVTVRTTRGDDIDAACGQLVGQVVDRTRRSERYRAQGGSQVGEVG